jgi:BRCT domain type II-containing protein
MSAIDQDKVRARAFEIWQAEGCPEGRDMEHWIRAEVELTPANSVAEVEPAAAPAKAKRAPARKSAEAPEAKPKKAAATRRTKATAKV